MQYFYEIMGLTWLAKSPIQLDSILIANSVIQANSKITELYKFNYLDSWCAAVADGTKGIHDVYSNTSAAVLENVNIQWMNRSTVEIDFNKIQQGLSQKKPNSLMFLGSVSTLALLTNTTRKGHLRIQHLGDSRVYGFSQIDQTWQCLTTDHTLLGEFSDLLKPKENEEYPKVFSRLTGSFRAFTGFDTFEEDEVLAKYGQVQNHQMSTYDALLICTKGVHEVLRNSKFWLPFSKDVTHKEWLMGMKQKLIKYGANDNASMLLIRLNVEHRQIS